MNRSRTLFIGAIIGALIGMIAAVLLNRRGKDEKSTALTTGDGIKLGVLIFGLLRAIASLGEDDKK
jgi:gas vesicle protein